MTNLLFFIIFSCTLTGFLCHYEPTVKNAVVKPDTLTVSTPTGTLGTKNAAELQAIAPVTAIKPNVSFISATVKSLLTIDTLLFQLSVHIDSSATIGEMPGLAQSGSDLLLIPQYIIDENGHVDISNFRNRRLSALKSVKEGTSIHVKIVRQPAGNWTIVDADTL